METNRRRWAGTWVVIPRQRTRPPHGYGPRSLLLVPPHRHTSARPHAGFLSRSGSHASAGPRPIAPRRHLAERPAAPTQRERSAGMLELESSPSGPSAPERTERVTPTREVFG